MNTRTVLILAMHEELARSNKKIDPILDKPASISAG